MEGIQSVRPAPGETRLVDDPTLQYLTTALVVREDCQALKELNELREKGWHSGNVHEHFEHFDQQQHQTECNKHDSTEAFWANKMYKCILHMDHMGRFVQASWFLDIGCYPGGYSTYVMRMCPQATGMGISLSVEEGGYGVAIPPDLLPRIDLVTHDVMVYNLAPHLAKLSAPLSPLPFDPHTFDFIICDAQYLRHNLDNIRRPWNWNRLLVSQILLGLRAVSMGGTMFIKLSHIERPFTARILLALCRVSNHVRTIKSKVVNASRGSFYALAQGVQTSSREYKELVSGLERLWYILNFEGQGCGREITWAEQDHVTPWTEVMSPRGIICIVRLGTRIWQTQKEGLKDMLRWKGVDVGVWQKKEVAANDRSENGAEI